MIPIKIKLVLFSVLVYFGVTENLLAQERYEYQGPLQVQNYTGDAMYSYKIVANDTLLDGPFQLKRSSLEALLEKEDISFLFKGDFKEGTANGHWQFQFGEFKSDSQSKVVDFEYRVLISGTQEEGSGVLKNGKPDGLWTYQVNQIKDSEKEKTLFKSDITFENGVPQRNFQIENEDAILIGRFLRNGLAHDEWTSYNANSIEDTESWFFEEGLLKKLQIIDEGAEKDIPVFLIDEDEYEIINLDKRFIEVVRLWLTNNQSSAVLPAGLPSLLAANAYYYEKIDSILSKLGTSDFKPMFKIQVPYFPIDSLDNDKLKSIADDYLKAESISTSLLNSSQLNILKRSDSNAAYYFNCVSKIQEDFLNPIGQFVSLKQQDILQFVKREEFIKSLWPLQKPSKVISTEIDSSGTIKTFELPNASDFIFTGNTIEAIKQLASYARASLESIKKELANQLIDAEQEQELINLEEQLIRENEALNTQIDSLAGSLSAGHSEALINIKKFADKSLSTYATIKDSGEKLNYGQGLKNCFSNLANLSTSISDLPRQGVEIDSLYQDSVWNPFMAVVMDEEVKKRITNAYNKVLITYFLDSASQDLNCELVEGLQQEMKSTFERMQQLRKEDTKKLERKLRRENDPKTILSLLNVQQIKADN